MYNVQVNNQVRFDIEVNSAQISVNTQVVDLDVFKLNQSSSHVLYQNQSFNTEIVDVDPVLKTCKIKVNGSIYEVQVKDQYDQLLKQLGLDSLAANKITEIKAPMPGLVLNAMVQPGDVVKKGDSLLVLEAMKMENILKSAAEGTVKKVLVNKGDKVEKNQILIQFE